MEKNQRCSARGAGIVAYNNVGEEALEVQQQTGFPDHPPGYALGGSNRQHRLQHGEGRVRARIASAVSSSPTLLTSD